MSTIRVNTLQNTSTTDGGISINNSGHVTVDGVAMPSSGPLSNRNLIINGAMQVAQRGTSSTSTGYQTVDRFTVSRNGVSVTQSQETLSSGDPYDEGFRYFLRYTNTATNSSGASFVEISQYIESQNVAQSGWNYKSSSSYITTSFWVRSSLAGTYYVHYNNDDVTTFVHNKAFTLSSNTWTKVTHSIPGDSSCVFNNDTGRGLRVVIVPHYGTDYTDSSSQTDAWFTRTTSNYSPDFAQNWSNSASATFDITGLQLEVGSVATPFEHRSYGDELARCRRYYYKIQAKASNTSGFFANAHNRSTTSALGVTQFPVEMRTSPTALEQSGTASDYTVNHGNNQTACSSVPAWFEADTFAARTNFTTAGSLTTGQGSILRSASTNAYLAWSAEL